MIRSAVLVSGKGTKLQSLLDSVFFGEIPELPAPARDVSGLTTEQAQAALARTQALAARRPDAAGRPHPPHHPELAPVRCPSDV